MTEPVEKLGRITAKWVPRATRDVSLPIGSPMALLAQFYWEQLDFEVIFAHLMFVHATRIGLRDQGSLDDQSEAPIMTTPDAIRAHFATARRIWIALGLQQRTYGSLDPALME